MQKTDKNLLDFLQNQVTVEKEIVASLEAPLRDMKNQMVKGVLKGVSLDSIKHADLYMAAISLLTSTPTALSQEHLDIHRALIEKHIEIESRLIIKLEAMIPKIDDKKVVFLLNAILSDEKRHHEMLKMVLEIVVKGETITEDDWWKLLWEGSPFHGAPGGG
jgi:bacterioferritin (cytochrome b1)